MRSRADRSRILRFLQSERAFTAGCVIPRGKIGGGAFCVHTGSVTDHPAPPPPNRLRATAAGDRPQERLERNGPAALSDTELLAMLLRSGTRGQDVLTLAARLLADAGSLAGLLAWRSADFRRLKGIGRVKALQLVTVLEIARRILRQEAGETPMLANGEAVTAFLLPSVAGLDVEKFWVLCLNRKNRLIKSIEISSGSATAALAHPREIFRAALREGAIGVVCAHNHPSGDPAPSPQDIHATRVIREAARTLDIQLIDHVIVGRVAADPVGRGYYSFREAGLI
jgi:DNA repair protein RadC